MINYVALPPPPYRVRAQRDEDRAMCLLLILAFISNQYVLPASTLLQSLPVKKDRYEWRALYPYA